MITIVVGTTEAFDEEKEEFVETGGFELEFEHSLASLSKWESKFKKPFLSKTEKSDEETLGYIEAMLLTESPPENWLNQLSRENVNDLSQYINDDMTATTFNDKDNGKQSREVITSELIYYWMVAATIPFECQYWHLNRLITLIKICGIKNQDPNKKKMSKSEIAARNRELNAQRRKQLGSKG